MHEGTGVTTVRFAPPDVGEAEVAAVTEVLRSGWLTTGPRAAEFERRFAAYVQAPHAVALNSCTAALHLSLVASNVGPGDHVVTTPLTFCATANVIVHCGATPVFADVEADTGNLDAGAAAAAVCSATRAVVPVHYAGRPVDLDAFEALARRQGAVLIEDAAHCVEGVSGGRKVGAVADFTCFSFYATKNLTTAEGGMVAVRRPEAADLVRRLSRHGLAADAWTRDAGGGRAPYDVTFPGFKCNMTDLQAAIGLCQLARIRTMHARRQAIWDRYDAGLADLPLGRPAAVPAGTVHARHLFTVRVNPSACGVTRDDLQQRLRDRGVSTSVHFPAVHLHSYYRERYGFRRGMFPNAEAIADETLSLPLSSALPDGHVDSVIEALHHALA